MVVRCLSIPTSRKLNILNRLAKKQKNKAAHKGAYMEDLYYMQFAGKVLDAVKLAESALDAEEYKAFLESVKRLAEQKLEKCN